MSLSEFQLIRKYFQITAVSKEQTVLGIGDDAAILRIPSGYKLVTSVTQMLFEPQLPMSVKADEIARQLLSQAIETFNHRYPECRADWMTLSLSLDNLEEDWLIIFSNELHACALLNKVQLIGGDTSKGTNIFRVNLSGLQRQLS